MTDNDMTTNKDNGLSETRQSATFGGGCFWCLEAVYNELNGVETVVSGYAGGHVANPSYHDISNGTTGHAEVVQITFDPAVIGYKEILDIFFTIHDPTTLNRQGPDSGTQYRSAILYHDSDQRSTAEDVIAEVTENELWDAPIVTEVKPLETFYEAEDYHQKYFDRNPLQPYCLAIIRPKVAKFRKKYLSKLKKDVAP